MRRQRNFWTVLAAGVLLAGTTAAVASHRHATAPRGALTAPSPTPSPEPPSATVAPLATAAAATPGLTPSPSPALAPGTLPNPALTPGAVDPVATLWVICHQSTTLRRNVPYSERVGRFAAYGIAYPPQPGQWELDHLVPLELSGSNTAANLWPERASPTPGFHEKDLAENWTHAQVCAGRMDLGAAQRQMATDWTVLYRQAISGYASR